MNYIVLDLEWNQCPNGKCKENRNLPFEIIEIGAVKLDESRRYVDEFHQLVKPVIYKELHHITRSLVRLSIEDLSEGDDFKEAVGKFFDWCGEDYIFCTWGSMDLTELQRNCRFFGIQHSFGMPFIFYDVQKLYSLCYSDGKTRQSLEGAIEEQQFEKDIPFNAALSDALYTARILEKMDFEKVKSYTSVDTFVIPASRAEEICVVYDSYSKYISRGFRDKDELMKDGTVFSTRCYKCNRPVRRKIRWFSTNQKIYYCLACCPEHGYIKGKLKIRKNDEDVFYATKILKITDEEGVNKIRQKQIAEREKRRERRHREKEKLRR